MQAAHAATYPSGQPVSLIDRLNGEWHETALRVFMVIVLAHWAEHLLRLPDLRARLAGARSARRAGLLLSLAGQVRDAPLRLRRSSCWSGLFVAAEGFHRRRRSAGGGRSRWRSSSSITSSTGSCSTRPSPATTSSAGRCRRASSSSGFRASSCTSSTTPSSSSRW